MDIGSATTGMAGALGFGEAKEAEGRGYTQQSFKKKKRHKATSYPLLSSFREAPARRSSQQLPNSCS